MRRLDLALTVTGFGLLMCGFTTFQEPAQRHGVIFFSTTFAVDPGEGSHLSYKINHSKLRTNCRAVATTTASAESCIVLRATRVRGCGLWF